MIKLPHGCRKKMNFIDDAIVLLLGISITILSLSLLVAIVVSFAKTNLFKRLDAIVSEVLGGSLLIFIFYIFFYPIVYISLIEYVFIDKKEEKKPTDKLLFFGVQTPLLMLWVVFWLYIIKKILIFINNNF